MDLLRIISVTAVLLAGLSTYSQEALWAHSFGGTMYDLATSTRIDNDDNQILTGSFQSTIGLGMDGPSFELTAEGILDGFIAKYDDEANLDWAIPIEGTGLLFTNDCAIDGDNNIYVVGGFTETSDFDPTGDVTSLTSNGGEDIFVAKYDNTGALVWAKSYGNGFFDRALDITVDNDGNAYIVGQFVGNLDMDPDGPDGLISSSMPDESAAFLLKLDAAGNFVYANKYWYSVPFGVELDNAGNVFVVGSSTGTTDFDLAFGDSYNVSPLGFEYGFVAKNASDFDFEWVYIVDDASGSFHKVQETAIEASGDLYISGTFQGTVDFDPSAGTSPLTASGGDSKPFSAKLNTDGGLEWVHSTAVLSDIYIDSDNNFYGAGNFVGTIDFDPGAGVESHTGSTGGDEGGTGSGFVQKMDEDGNLLWLDIIQSGMGPSAFTKLNSISADSDENIYVTGQYADSIYVNTSPESEFEAAGITDSYIIKYGIDCDIDNSITATGTTLTVAEAGATYQWLDCDDGDAEIPGATSQSYTAIANGNYACKVTTPDCELVSDCIAITTVGITDNDTFDFAVYPNPTNGILQLNTSELTESNLYTSNGEFVLTTSDKQIDMTHLSKGLYIIKITTAKGILVKKIHLQ